MPIAITSTFKPLTYDEIAKPLIEQTKAQEELEDTYSTASAEAAALMAKADQATDTETYQRLKNYANAVQQQADALLSSGLNRNSRKALLDLRNQYAKEVVPIQAAVTRRDELEKERRQLMQKNPDMVWERDVLRLDDMLDNPTLDYGRTLSTNTIEGKAAELAQAIGNAEASIAASNNVDKYTKALLIQNGLTPEEIQYAIDHKDTTILGKALDNLYLSTGVSEWNNASAQDQVRAAIASGAMRGTGQVKLQLENDAAALRADARRDKEEDRLFQAALYGLKRDKDGNWVYDSDHPGPKVKRNSDGSVKTNENSNITAVRKDDKLGWIYNVDGVYCTEKNGRYTPLEDQSLGKAPEQVAFKYTELNHNPLYVDTGGDKGDAIRKAWDDWDEKEISIEEFKKLGEQDANENDKKAYDAVVRDLKGRGISLDDPGIVVMKDQDIIGRNRYKVTYDPGRAAEAAEAETAKAAEAAKAAAAKPEQKSSDAVIKQDLDRTD